jgi:hypothetical protein
VSSRDGRGEVSIHGLSVGRFTIPVKTTPGDRVTERTVPAGAGGAAEDRPPARTFGRRNTRHRGLTPRTRAGRLLRLHSLGRRRSRRYGRGLLASQQRAAASEVGLPMPTAEAAEAAGLGEAFGQDVHRPATGELDARQRVRFPLVARCLVVPTSPEGDLAILVVDQAPVGDRAAGQAPRQVLQDLLGLPRRPRGSLESSARLPVRHHVEHPPLPLANPPQIVWLRASPQCPTLLPQAFPSR